ncbi:multidrug efflux pump subunit AcrA (membrane-fusion protein) [Mariniflexile fucanivorans]|uniref:Multidrug efflux pump subunit AcrA (Membrane-fusion protein) n=1 Tax=Mariniflexile fucanivorans TaxID=264023 RepID=A0A4R1RH76_9FLAO|nr:HlyD family efflux transporter periplasmic adaptor subunit [Mariniflexile fucanivorans]TCL65415.1 multidrug efflux pump subunit AcrA (membrane-fusion protein) [Mariniflexile fucanivorans]
MRKIILSFIGVLLIIASFFLAKSLIANKNKPKPILEKVTKTVFTDTVKNGEVQIRIPANGSLVAKRRVEIYSEVQGLFKMGNLLFKPGQKYGAGQSLIRIDASEHYASVQSSKSNLYNSISAIMPDLRLDFPEVYQKWQNYLNAFDLNKTTPKLPEMSSEKENYFITGRGIVSNYYNLKNLEQRLSKYVISAPFTGILTEALVTEGTLIRSGQKLGEFIDPTDYEMEVAISKTYANLLKVGEAVDLNNLNKTETYKGKISRVNGSIDQTTQTITAYIDVKHENLKEGIYLEANINGEIVKNAIEIDRNLLLEDQQVFVIKDGMLDTMPVTPVYFSETKVVLKDLPNGAIILKKPVPGAYVGMLVKPFQANQTSKP